MALLDVRQGEWRRLIPLTLAYGLVLASVYVLKPVRNALFLDQLGVSPDGRSLFDFTATFPDVLPSDLPTGGELQEFLETVLCPAIEPAASLTAT